MIHMSADHPKLRSEAWFDKSDDVVMRHRGVLHLLGYDPYEVVGRPIIGIYNPHNNLNNCEYGFDELAAAIKRGIEAAGAIPMEFATMTLGGELCKPADMLYRNLVSMSVEETLRGYPIDGVVLLCNCDKTTPAQLMAAASADVPAMQFLQNQLEDLSGEDLNLAQSTPLFLGIAMDPFATTEPAHGDYLIRNMTGYDPESGSLAIGAEIGLGRQVQFHLRDGRCSSNDLESVLEQGLREGRLSGAGTRGALLFSCLGRGEHLYGRPNHDSEMFRNVVGHIPLSGFFCNGEIGPVQGSTYIHGYTSAFGVLREKES